MKLMEKTNLYQEAEARLNQVRYFKEKITDELKKYPEGKIRIAKRKGKVQFSLRENPSEKTGTYISKADTAKIKTFLQKNYYQKVLKLLEKEEKGLQDLLKSSDNMDGTIQSLFSNEPEEVKKHIIPIDMSDADIQSKWSEVAYSPLPVAEGKEIFITDLGECVKSKSELNIANTLNRMGISYKYECPLKLKDGIVVYPDFTFLDLKNRKPIYWEHRGMMDDRGYATRTVRKINQYRKNGIFLGNDLIITEETLADPLGTRDIVSTINHYLK